MSDGPRIVHPFEPPPQAKEIAYNAARWAELARRELPRSVGFIMLMFPKDQIGQGRGVAVGNVNQEAIKDELRAVVKRWSDHPRILTFDE